MWVGHELSFMKKMTYDKPTLMENDFELSSVESEAYWSSVPTKFRTIMTKTHDYSKSHQNGISY